jgi:DNA-binding transcriptional MerR regulator
VGERGGAAAGRGSKSPSAFRTTSEVAEELDLAPHVLRFWESKFTALKPVKRGGGRRYYRPEDIALLRQIQKHLYRDGYTIRGVQKLLREGALAETPPAGEGSAPLPPRESAERVKERPSSAPLRATLVEVRGKLLAIRALIHRLLEEEG